MSEYDDTLSTEAALDQLVPTESLEGDLAVDRLADTLALLAEELTKYFSSIAAAAELAVSALVEAARSVAPVVDGLVAWAQSQTFSRFGLSVTSAPESGARMVALRREDQRKAAIALLVNALSRRPLIRLPRLIRVLLDMSPNGPNQLPISVNFAIGSAAMP